MGNQQMPLIFHHSTTTTWIESKVDSHCRTIDLGLLMVITMICPPSTCANGAFVTIQLCMATVVSSHQHRQSWYTNLYPAEESRNACADVIVLLLIHQTSDTPAVVIWTLRAHSDTNCGCKMQESCSRIIKGFEGTDTRR